MTQASTLSPEGKAVALQLIVSCSFDMFIGGGPGARAAFVSLSSHSTAEPAFRRMPSRSTGGSSMRSLGTNPTAHGSSPHRRSSSTASARSARLFLGPRSLGAE